VDRIIRDILYELGIEKPHPEDIMRLQMRYFEGMGGMRTGAVKLAWPWIFGKWKRAREERAMANAFSKHRERMADEPGRQ